MSEISITIQSVKILNDVIAKALTDALNELEIVLVPKSDCREIEMRITKRKPQ